MFEYAVIFIPDEMNLSGIPYDWSAKGSQWRSSLSAYGEEIPYPVIGYAIPWKIWLSDFEPRFRCSTSGRCSCGYSYRMTAAERNKGIQNDIAKIAGLPIWTGMSTEIPTYIRDGKEINNKGMSVENMLTGTFNRAISTFDGIFKRKFGCTTRECLGQIKFLGVTFHKVDDEKNKLKRGNRAGYVTANGQ